MEASARSNLEADIERQIEQYERKYNKKVQFPFTESYQKLRHLLNNIENPLVENRNALYSQLEKLDYCPDYNESEKLEIMKSMLSGYYYQYLRESRHAPNYS